MTKILNIDTLSSDQRTIVLGGVEHEVLEMSVENFIATTKQAELLQSTDAALTAQVESAIDLIQRSVPSAPRETLLKLKLRHLQTIVAFVRGDDVQEEALAQPEAQAAEGKPAKEKARK
jgi:hypothetical protein